MLLDCVLTATDSNPLYCEFIPIFIKAWKVLLPNVDVKIIFVGEEIPLEYREWEDYLILFNPPDEMLTSFVAQYIRLLYPALMDYREGVLITDMDMLPMQANYYTKNIASIPPKKFVHYRSSLVPHCPANSPQYSMCYNVARPSTWGALFDIASILDVKTKLEEAYQRVKYDGLHGGAGWCTDQIDLYQKINGYPEFVILGDEITGYRRLCRSQNLKWSRQLSEAISAGTFTDFHALRPYSKWKEFNDAVIDSLSGPLDC